MPSAVGVAVVCTLPASDPASGSVSANAASFEPSSSPGSHRSCCSLVPNSSSARMPMLWWALTNTATLASWPPRTSIVLQVLLLVEAEAAELRRDGHAEDAEVGRGRGPRRRGCGPRGRSARASMWASAKRPDLGGHLVGRGLLLGGEGRVREEEVAAELAEEQRLGEAERRGRRCSSSTCFRCSAICAAVRAMGTPLGRVGYGIVPRGGGREAGSRGNVGGTTLLRRGRRGW